MAGFLVETTIAIAQAPDKIDRSTFGFSVGLSHFQLKERLINNLAHTGWGFCAGGIYLKPAVRSNHRLAFNVGFNMLKSAFEEESSTYLIHSSLTYRYNYRIISINDRTDLYIGGQAGMEATQGIYENWDENHFYWLTAYTLGLNGRLQINVSDRSAFSFEGNLPFIALVSRTPATRLIHEDNPVFSSVVGKIHEHPSLASWPDHFAVEFKLGYTFSFKGKSRQTIFWQGNYISNDIARSKKINIINHTAGIEFLF